MASDHCISYVPCLVAAFSDDLRCFLLGVSVLYLQNYNRSPARKCYIWDFPSFPVETVDLDREDFLFSSVIRCPCASGTGCRFVN